MITKTFHDLVFHGFIVRKLLSAWSSSKNNPPYSELVLMEAHLKCAEVLCCVMSPETQVLKQHFSALSYRIIQKLSSRAPAREGELQ